MADEKNRSLKTNGARSILRNIARTARILVRKFESLYPFKSLTQLIIILNLFGFAILVSGALYLNQFRAGLIDTKVQSLLIQGEIIASALAVTAAIGTDNAPLGPGRTSESDSGRTGGLEGDDGLGSLEFLINPERAAPDFGKLIQPTGTRARIYDRDGWLMLDSDAIYARGGVSRYKLPPPADSEYDIISSLWQRISKWLWQQELPVYKEIGSENGKAYPEVATALTGTSVPIVRVNEKGELVVSVAVPVRKLRAVLGVLLLSTRGGEIDSIVAAERWVLLRVALVAAGVTMLLSVIMARTIAGPMRQLSAAAERVRRRIKAREEIPDFTHRSDEIGHLSTALRDMTTALYRQIDATESFAADVSHELKNPLTSLRSAAETLPRVRTREARKQLVDVIQDDVKRLDRLISDISNASRLDAELSRQDAGPVDMAELLSNIVPALNSVKQGRRPQVVLDIAEAKERSGNSYIVVGHDTRLGQVINNVLENAISFSPTGKQVHISAQRIDGEIEIAVDDQGPGIPPENLTKIFDRFYTDRPGEESFGRNSGLGLNISQQIIAAHGGRIWAENRPAIPTQGKRRSGANGKAKPSANGGARFVIRLPAA
ncbi:MAG: sensor histidine kinase [Hyphomicrobiales bacterium]|nr:sensor histidine kinase [Hyphomicrobiales bacterium]